MFGLDHADQEFLATMALGVSALLVAIFQLQKRARLTKTGIASEGVVVRIECEGYQEPIYYPVIRFHTLKQEQITARYNVGTNPASFTEGDVVQIRYDQLDPSCFIITSDGLGWAGRLFAFIGAGLSFYGIMQYVNS